MTRRAEGSFDVTLTPIAAHHGDDPPVGRFALDKVFRGDLAATSRGEMLAVQSGVKGSAGYVAIERVVGSLHGAQGSFALQHGGTMDRGTPTLVVHVIPDSGTDALTGLRGTLDIVIADGRHSYIFDYELD